MSRFPRRLAACFLSLTFAATAAELPRGLDVAGADVQKLSIDEAIEMMLRNNLEVQFNRIDMRLEDARTRFAAGVFDPVFRMSLSRESTNIPDLTSDLSSAQQIALATAFPEAFAGKDVVIFDRDTDRWESSLTFRSPLGTQLAVTARQSKVRSTFDGDTRDITPFYTAFGGFEVRQPLLKDFGLDANLNDLRISRINRKVAEYTWNKTLQENLASVLGNYFDMLFAQADLRVKQDAIAADQKLVQQNQRRSELGFMSPIDVQQARAQVSLDEEQLILSKNIFMERQFALRRLITSSGQDSANRIYLPVQMPDLAPSPGTRETHLQTAFRNRPDYLAAVTDAEKQDIRLKFAKNQLYPNLDLVGTYGYNGLDQAWGLSRQDAWHSQAPQWSFGVQFSVPLGRVQGRAQLDVFKGFKEQSILRIKQSENTITVDVDTSLSRIETSRQRLATARQTRELNDEAVRIAYRRLDEGQISSFDLIEIQRKMYDAKSRELDAQASLNKSIVTLWQATGTMLENLKVDIVQGPRKKDLPDTVRRPPPIKTVASKAVVPKATPAKRK